MKERNSQRQRIEALAAEATYARDRYRLYRAKSHGSRPTSPGRLRELKRVSDLAERVLRRAESTLSSADPADEANKMRPRG